MAAKIKVPFAKNIREWFAFFGGEELGVSLEHASIIWDAAIKNVEKSRTSTNNRRNAICLWKYCGEEAYGPGWIRAVVMVHPSGDIHYIGGDREDGEGDTEYRAAKYLRHASKIVEAAPSASTNTASLKLPEWEALWNRYVSDYMAANRMQPPVPGIRERCREFYDFIVRQLQA